MGVPWGLLHAGVDAHWPVLVLLVLLAGPISASLGNLGVNSFLLTPPLLVQLISPVTSLALLTKPLMVSAEVHSEFMLLDGVFF